MKASQKAQEIWFGKCLKIPDKEKASGRQPRSLTNQRSHANDTICLSKTASPLTISGLVSKYERGHFKRFSTNTPLPEDILDFRGDV